MEEQPHEDPQTDYERMLDRHGLDCSRYGCWAPIRAIALNQWGEQIGFCADHAQAVTVVRWLES
jgi:hypothetical protein